MALPLALTSLEDNVDGVPVGEERGVMQNPTGRARDEMDPDPDPSAFLLGKSVLVKDAAQEVELGDSMYVIYLTISL